MEVMQCLKKQGKRKRKKKKLCVFPIKVFHMCIAIAISPNKASREPSFPPSPSILD